MVTAVALLAAASFFVAAPPPVESFAEAKPVWMAGEERATNSFCAIRCRFKGDAGAAALRVTAAYDYRVRLNGRCLTRGTPS